MKSIANPTIYNVQIAAANFSGIDHIPLPNTTLNTKLNIFPNEMGGVGEKHITGYYAIGDKGHRIVEGANNAPYIRPVPHSPRHASLYNMLPFVLREITDDLSSTQRANYALRRIETHNSRQYVAYYLKKLPTEALQVSTVEMEVDEDGVINTLRPFEPTTDDLNPDPTDFIPDGDSNVIVTSGKYLAARLPVLVNFDANDANEFRNVARILYDNESRSVISEIALVAGIERVLTGAASGTNTINYTDLISTQVTGFIDTFYQMDMSRDGFSIHIDVGDTESLYIQQPDG